MGFDQRNQNNVIFIIIFNSDELKKLWQFGNKY
jgi:hypothetical protein